LLIPQVAVAARVDGEGDPELSNGDSSSFTSRSDSFDDGRDQDFAEEDDGNDVAADDEVEPLLKPGGQLWTVLLYWAMFSLIPVLIGTIITLGPFGIMSSRLMSSVMRCNTLLNASPWVTYGIFCSIPMKSWKQDASELQ
jgi:hypothetical protein